MFDSSSHTSLAKWHTKCEGALWLAPDVSISRLRKWAETTTELGLMHRQCDILSLVTSSLPNRRIALLLGLLECTARQLPTGLLKRLGVKTRVEILTHMRGRNLVLEKYPCA